MNVKKEIFGKLEDNTEVYLYTLKNENGAVVEITNFGAAVVSLSVPDKNGKVENVILGFDNLEDYINIRGFYGATVGRYGNRIAKGKFSIGGTEYQIPVNDGENSLHGGIKGFDRVVWNSEEIAGDNPGIKLSYLSKDGEEGYPGNLNVTVTYTLTNDNELKIDYTAETDKATVHNITNHSYFNLSGDVKDDILSHVLTMNCSHYNPVVKGLIPTGELASVEGTPFNFTHPQPIGSRINEDNEQLKLGLGYDHNFIINDADGTLKLACKVFEPTSGRVMEVFTTEPSMQFYSGNFMDGSHAGHDGKVYNYREAMCLETQHYPDSPNQDNFPSTLLEPGTVYKSSTIYKFSTK